MTPISGAYFQEQLEAKNEALYFLNAELAKLKNRVATLECALEEAREYFADHADVRDGPEDYEHEQKPNEAMRLMITIDDALGRVS